MKTSTRFATKGPDSPLEGVSSAAWQRFVAGLEIQGMSDVSESGGLGSYDVRARRLVELGYARNLRRDTIGKRQVYLCDFVLPWTQKRFLSDPVAQYAVLVKSMRAYYNALSSGELQKPQNISMAGALAILHVGGRGALRNADTLFENTKKIYDAVQGAF